MFLRALPLLVSAAFLLAPALPAHAQDTPQQDEDERERRMPRSPGRGGPMGEDWTKRAVDFLSDELELTDPQAESIKKIFDDMTSDMMGKVGELFATGEMEKARKMIEEMRVEVAKKISKVLTPDQRRQFEILSEQFDRRAAQWEQERRVGGDISQLFNPKPQSKRLQIAKAERLLFVSPEEVAVILPLVEAVVDGRVALFEGRRARRKDLLNAQRGGASKKEIADRVAEIRAAEQFQRLELAASMERLRDVLTIDQEVRFVAAGILD